MILTSYVLGHAAQALGNIFSHSIEISLLDTDTGSAPQWMRENAEEPARKILKVVSHKRDRPRVTLGASPNYPHYYSGRVSLCAALPTFC